MIKLVCFDFDGVIAQTEAHHTSMTMKELDSYDIKYTSSDLSHLMGGNLLVRPKLFDDCFSSQENYQLHREEIIKFKHHPYNIKELITPHVKEFMQKLKDNNIKIAVCSNSDENRVHNELVNLEMDNLVDAIYGGTDTGHTKPDPYIYLIAMQNFNAKPEETIVFEDSYAGIKAGKNSQALTIAIKDPFGISDQHEADYIINDFKDADKYIF